MPDFRKIAPGLIPVGMLIAFAALLFGVRMFMPRVPLPYNKQPVHAPEKSRKDPLVGKLAMDLEGMRQDPARALDADVKAARAKLLFFFEEAYLDRKGSAEFRWRLLELIGQEADDISRAFILNVLTDPGEDIAVRKRAFGLIGEYPRIGEVVQGIHRDEKQSPEIKEEARKWLEKRPGGP